jgi:hypothetical protein
MTMSLTPRRKTPSVTAPVGDLAPETDLFPHTASGDVDGPNLPLEGGTRAPPNAATEPIAPPLATPVFQPTQESSSPDAEAQGKNIVSSAPQPEAGLVSKAASPPCSECSDLRERLYNDRREGAFAEVQLPLERITRLHAIMFDLDPKVLRPGNGLFNPADDPVTFHAQVRPVLDRHRLAAHAEVRASGTGLHLLLWLDPPVELHTDEEQRRWGAVVKAVQRTLPVDPDMPGITALTRPIGSVNSKNYATVRTLTPGWTVQPAAVEEFVRRLGNAPFRTVASVLLGAERVTPCPLCKRKDKRLDVLDRRGKCYGSCGAVHLHQLFDLIYEPRQAPPAQTTESESP